MQHTNEANERSKPKPNILLHYNQPIMYDKILSKNMLRPYEKIKTGNYMTYAIGEIVLEVIGVLIALQINNWNEGRKIKENEVVYLNHIKRDLQSSMSKINQFVMKRNSLIH